MSEIDTTRAVLAAVLKERDALRAELETSQKQSAANFIRAREWAERSGKLEAELEASRAQWRPIETAPKDGTHILLVNREGVSEGGWLSDMDHGADYEGQIGMAGWWRADGTDWPNTNWMPLPAPPAIASQAPAQEGAPASPSGA